MVTIEDIRSRKSKIAVVGLGYVGLPLAVAFGTCCDVIGFDIDRKKVEELKQGHDATGEVSSKELAATKITYTADAAQLSEAAFIIVTVPTPIDVNNNPDLTPVRSASITTGNYLQPGSIVVYESTVYPGVTEDICVPLLEEHSGLQCGRDFTVGYSPERINPGDKVHTVDKIIKVVSGQDAETLDTVAGVYEMVISVGVHRASSIQVAEAAKVIENTQRDLNIALMNELSIIFGKLNIPTRDVLAAAGTKWNFLPFTPGLVGGHCIGVDPYYLTHKAEEIGYNPQVILAGRRINDGMGKYVAENTVKKMIRAGKTIKGARVLVLGLTFKENVPDIRNTRVIDVVRELEDYDIEVIVNDPVADAQETLHEYGIELTSLEKVGPVDAIVWAVAHEIYKSISFEELKKMCSNGNSQAVLIDVKGCISPQQAEAEGLIYWSL
ncbi:nucleotide sugar dehydrogenase [uncultured Desulfuromonas sp.]|uniref:nucleotide sugar dehydrogenase n=1 Tax=uncultured Desulfuromonas sp. TaxID=181013 RepID=UPI002AAB8856|nr:nucleotide sugar dehydrogenase [uncultured Desulfuromonas sp.]